MPGGVIKNPPQTFGWGHRRWGSGDRRGFEQWLRNHPGAGNYAQFAQKHKNLAAILGPQRHPGLPGGGFISPSGLSQGGGGPKPDGSPGGGGGSGGGSGGGGGGGSVNPYGKFNPFDPTKPLTPAQMNQLIKQYLAAAMAPEKTAIERERALAQAQSLAKRQEIEALGAAQAGILGAAAPGVQKTYQTAADAVAGYAGAYTGQQGDQLRQQAQEGSDFVKSQVGASLDAPNIEGAQNAAYASTGAIPATGLAEQGATWGAAAAMAPVHVMAQARDDVLGELAKASSTDRDFGQKLIDLAGKAPQMRLEIMDMLQKIEFQKFENRMAMGQLGLEGDKLDFAKSEAKKEWKFKWAGLALSNQKDKAAAQKAAKQGREVDASASKAVGYLVDQMGRPILRGGHRISVKKGEGTTRDDRQKIIHESSKDAFDFAAELKADLKNQSFTFGDVVNRVWGKIDGDGLVRQGIARSKLRRIVRAAVYRAGWRPSGGQGV